MPVPDRCTDTGPYLTNAAAPAIEDSSSPTSCSTSSAPSNADPEAWPSSLATVCDSGGGSNSTTALTIAAAVGPYVCKA